MTDSSENETSSPRQRKPCIACREPIQPDARVCPQCGSPQSGARWKFLGTTLKWIGAVTALISLIVGSFQLNGLLQASRERSEAVQKLVKAADMQIEYSDLESALQLVEQAIELQPGSRAAGERQVTVAMMLLRRGFDYYYNKEGWKEKIDSLMPVLYRGAVDADPVKAADALAHIGLANKIRRKMLNKEFPIEEYFQRAVALDADNVFAHVFWAASCLNNSWRMECGNNLEAAEEHFAMAMQDGRHQDYVRRKRFDSLRATSVEGANFLLIGEMITSWRNNVPLDAKQQRMIRDDFPDFYYRHDGHYGQKLVSLVQRFQPAEILGILEWASEGQKWKDDWDGLRIMALMAHLTELTGNRPLALERYKAVRMKLRREEGGSSNVSPIRERVDWSLANLLEIRPGWLGIKYERISEELVRSLGMADTQGLFISEVIPAGPGEVGGLLTGDVILEVAGRAAKFQSMKQILGTKVAGDTLALTIFRKGERKLLQLTLGEATASSFFAKPQSISATSPLSLLMDQMLYRSHTIDVGEKSMRIATLTDELRTGFEVNTDAPAVLILGANFGEWESGLWAGDLILAVNNQPVSNADEVATMIEQARQNGESSLLFSRLRAGERQTIAIKIN
ncbi:MAG: PDZ domain-containing protein [Desulfobulbaceae bacterium]|nr:PDZ domain-containing protein [Desulfobulbaceae bacterium]